MDSFHAQEPAGEFILNNSFLRCLSFIRFAANHTLLPEARRWPPPGPPVCGGLVSFLPVQSWGESNPRTRLGRQPRYTQYAQPGNWGTQPSQVLTKGRPQESSEGESVNPDIFFQREKSLWQNPCLTVASDVFPDSFIHLFKYSAVFIRHLL